MLHTVAGFFDIAMNYVKSDKLMANKQRIIGIEFQIHAPVSARVCPARTGLEDQTVSRYCMSVQHPPSCTYLSSLEVTVRAYGRDP